MARPKIPIDEERVEELASLGCSAEEIASLLTPPGSQRPVDHRTIEAAFCPYFKKGTPSTRSHAQEPTRSSCDGRGHRGADFRVHGLREPRGDEFNVHVSATATANAKPTSFAINEEIKRKLYEAELVIRREALQQNEGRN
jgi:hypothetical protein